MSLLVALPVVLPLTTAVVLLALFHWPRVQKGIAIGSNVLQLSLSFALLAQVQNRGIQVHLLSGWPPPYGIILVADLLSSTLLTVTAGVFLASLVYSLGYMRKEVLRFSYLPLFFFLITGVSGAFLTGDIFNLFVFFEVMLLSTYALVISWDPEGLISRAEKLEATFKYLVLNLIGASVMLLAIGTLYGTTGTLNMADLSVRIRDLRESGVVHLDLIALLFVAVFGLKAAAAPFHFWLPDVHPSAPTPVSAILSGILIKVGAYGLIRLTTLLFVGLQGLTEVILILGLVTLLLGGVMAVGQLDIKRLLAYSSISQMGFLLLGVGLATGQAIAAALFFLINHAIIKSMLFLAAGGVMHMTRERSMLRMGGLARSSPFLAVSFLIGVMALAGLPPLNGFISKLLIFQTLIDAGRLPYVLIALIGAFLSVLYTFRAWLNIFWGESKHVVDGSASLTLLLPVGSLAVLCLILGIFPEPLVNLVSQAGIQAASPDLYVEAVLGGAG
ncbi:MAG: complex I subunit 5 family protein [Thermoplasmata archaeon]